MLQIFIEVASVELLLLNLTDQEKSDYT
jgi:hypothetical protein